MNDRPKDKLARELAMHLVDHPVPMLPECPVCQSISNHVAAWDPEAGLEAPV
jgi:hypothetical protein